MAIGPTYNPSNVMFGRPGNEMVGRKPYVWNGPGQRPPMPNPGGPIQGGQPPLANGGAPISGGSNFNNLPASITVPSAPGGTSGTVGPRNVRATGTGPFDPAYRQNLASYGGGQFSGNLSFNPTDISSFPGNPTGGGTAPVSGMPTSLMDMALAGQGFSWNPSAPANTATKPPNYGDMQSWMDQFMKNGRGQRMGSFMA